jgi:hypothetical protein
MQERSTAHHVIYLQFDISGNTFEIRAAQTPKCIVWCAVDCTSAACGPTGFMFYGRCRCYEWTRDNHPRLFSNIIDYIKVLYVYLYNNKRWYESVNLLINISYYKSFIFFNWLRRLWFGRNENQTCSDNFTSSVIIIIIIIPLVRRNSSTTKPFFIFFLTICFFFLFSFFRHLRLFFL